MSASFSFFPLLRFLPPCAVESVVEGEEGEEGEGGKGRANGKEGDEVVAGSVAEQLGTEVHRGIERTFPLFCRRGEWGQRGSEDGSGEVAAQEDLGDEKLYGGGLGTEEVLV